MTANWRITVACQYDHIIHTVNKKLRPHDCAEVASGGHEKFTCATDVGLSESVLPKDDVGDDDQRSCEVCSGGSRPLIQPGAPAGGDSTTLPNGGPIAPSVLMPRLLEPQRLRCDLRTDRTTAVTN